MTDYWQIAHFMLVPGDIYLILHTSAGEFSCRVRQMFADYVPEDPDKDLNQFHPEDERAQQAFLQQQGLLFEKGQLDIRRGLTQGVMTRLLDSGWDFLSGEVADPSFFQSITMRRRPDLPFSASDPGETLTLRSQIDIEAVHRRGDVEASFLEKVFLGNLTAWQMKFLSRYGLSGAIVADNADKSESSRFLIGQKWPSSRTQLVRARLIAALLQGGWEPFEYRVSDIIRWHVSFHPPYSLVNGNNELTNLWRELESSAPGAVRGRIRKHRNARS